MFYILTNSQVSLHFKYRISIVHYFSKPFFGKFDSVSEHRREQIPRYHLYSASVIVSKNSCHMGIMIIYLGVHGEGQTPEQMWGPGGGPDWVRLQLVPTHLAGDSEYGVQGQGLQHTRQHLIEEYSVGSIDWDAQKVEVCTPNFSTKIHATGDIFSSI